MLARTFPLALLAVSCFTILRAPAQQPPTPQNQNQTTLNVVVTDRKGTPVPNLPQSDFVVHVDGRAVPVSDFHPATALAPGTPPVETTLVIDAVNTRTINVAYERSQVEKYLRSNGGHLAQPTSIVIVTDTKTEIIPTVTRDGNSLANALDRAETGLREFYGRQGFYGWVEQFDISSRALRQVAAYEASRPGNKLLLWISPGWPLLSGPEIQLDKKDSERFFSLLVSLTDQLRAAHITLSSIDPLGTQDSVSYRTIFYQQFTKPVANARHMEIGNLALQVLATQSGGRVLNGNNDTSRLIRQAASDADAFYTMTVPLPEAAGDNAVGFHSFAVTTEDRGLIARTPTVLYATPGPANPPQPSVPPPAL